MLYQLETTGVILQGIAGNTGFQVIGFREAAVYHHQLAIGLDGVFAFQCLYRDMAVDDVAMLAFHTEFVQNHVAYLFVVTKGIIVALGFLVQFLVVQEVALEGCHLGLVEGRGVLAAPQVPYIVHGESLFFIVFFHEVSGTDEVSHLFEQGFSFVLLALNLDFTKASIGIERNGGVEEQVGVGDGVHASVAEDVADMLLQLFAAYERAVQFLYNFLFFFGQLVGVQRVDGREVAILHRIVASVDGDGAFFVVDAVQQHAVVHLELGTSADGCGFQLELDDADGLVHLCQETEGLRVADGFTGYRTETEQGARVVGIGFHREGGKRQQVDAIAVFQYAGIAEAGHETHHVGYTDVVTGSCPHPKNVVVPPLDVPVMIVAKDVHDMMRSVSAVEDVAQDVEHVDGEPLYQVTERDDEVVGTAGADDAVSVSERCLMLSPTVIGLSDAVSVSERCLMLSPAVRGLSDTVSVSERCLMLSRYQSAV